MAEKGVLAWKIIRLWSKKRAVWQRVNPALQPYPADAAQDAVNVCCMGVNAQQDADVIRGFIEEELSDRRGYLTYAAMAPSPMARQLMRRLAAEEGGHARRLLGVYYLITGQVYCPAVPQPGRDAFPPGGKFYVCDTTRRAAGA